MALLAVFLLAGACGGEDVGADADGCEHLEGGPAVAVTASQTADTGAPPVFEDHKRYDIALEGGSAELNTGYVTFAARKAIYYVFFLGQDVPLSVRDAEGANVAKDESSDGSPACDAILGRHVVGLPVGTYILGFGPTEESEVQLVIERADEAPRGEGG